jgi:hypothetical protein
MSCCNASDNIDSNSGYKRDSFYIAIFTECVSDCFHVVIEAAIEVLYCNYQSANLIGDGWKYVMPQSRRMR